MILENSDPENLCPLELRLSAAWPLATWQDKSLLVAVSGGADSVALLRALVRLKSRAEQSSQSRLFVAHFNHAVRGAAAERDATFVAQLAQQLGVEYFLGKRSANKQATDENSLRAERYEFLQATAERISARYVVTAHTADDQVETVLLRLLRGTGLAGLQGIQRTRSLGEAAVLIRPMLQIQRVEILAYLKTLEQTYCEDASNRDTDYTRNRLRHELLPLLKRDFNPQVEQAILRLSTQARDVQMCVAEEANKLLAGTVQVVSANEVVVLCPMLSQTPRHLLRELLIAIWQQQAWPLQEMGFEEWNRLACSIKSATSQTYDLPGPVRAKKAGESLSLTRLL